jgi:hypothetical protein
MINTIKYHFLCVPIISRVYVEFAFSRLWSFLLNLICIGWTKYVNCTSKDSTAKFCSNMMICFIFYEWYCYYINRQMWKYWVGLSSPSSSFSSSWIQKVLLLFFELISLYLSYLGSISIELVCALNCIIVSVILGTFLWVNNDEFCLYKSGIYTLQYNYLNNLRKPFYIHYNKGGNSNIKNHNMFLLNVTKR